ncbi:transposase [Paenibacillus illinoisensis]|uniref:transposase n=1 Tax=Paenibacillus illinoisensis TaxID=59845 RepID=UPI003C6E175D
MLRCPHCGSTHTNKYGVNSESGTPRFRCIGCGKTFSSRTAQLLLNKRMKEQTSERKSKI